MNIHPAETHEHVRVDERETWARRFRARAEDLRMRGGAEQGAARSMFYDQALAFEEASIALFSNDWFA